MAGRSSLLTFAVLAGLVSLAAQADDTADAVKKQKAAAERNLSAAKLKAGYAETDNLLVYTPGTDEKAKALATTLQKTHTAATRALKVGPEEKLWTGKLTVYVFNDNRQYKGFVLQALKRPPQSRETYALELRGDEPFILAGPSLGEKPTDSQLAADTSTLVAAAVLSRKAGPGTTTVPEWLLLGFGRATYLRTDPSGVRLNSHKAKVKALYGKTRGTAFRTAIVWGGQTSPDTETIVTSFVEFLAYGPMAEKFPAFVTALKPTEDNPNPTPESAMAALEWKPEAVEAAWQKWVATGK